MKKIIYIFVIILSIPLLYYVYKEINVNNNTSESFQINDYGELPKLFVDHINTKDDLYVISIFATWCSSCLKEHEFIMNYESITKIPIYAVAVNEGEDDIQEFLGKYGNPYKKIIYNFPFHKLEDIKIDKIPRVLIIRKNKIIFDHEGVITKSILQNELLPIARKFSRW